MKNTMQKTLKQDIKRSPEVKQDFCISNNVLNAIDIVLLCLSTSICSKFL